MLPCRITWSSLMSLALTNRRYCRNEIAAPPVRGAFQTGAEPSATEYTPFPVFSNSQKVRRKIQTRDLSIREGLSQCPGAQPSRAPDVKRIMHPPCPSLLQKVLRRLKTHVSIVALPPASFVSPGTHKSMFCTISTASLPQKSREQSRTKLE